MVKQILNVFSVQLENVLLHKILLLFGVNISNVVWSAASVMSLLYWLAVTHSTLFMFCPYCPESDGSDWRTCIRWTSIFSSYLKLTCLQQWTLVLLGDPSSQTMIIVGICIVVHLIHVHTGNVCSHLACELCGSVSAVVCGNRNIYQGLWQCRIYQHLWQLTMV
jgi:hypothetical protein